MRSILIVAAALSLAFGSATLAKPAPCRDAHGKFTKCPAAAPAAPKKCRDAKGHFAKCGTPGAKPA